MRTTFFSLFFLIAFISCMSRNEKNSMDNKSVQPEIDSSTMAGIPEGQILYLQHCSACHQTDGSGVPGMYPPLLDNLTVSGERADLIRIVLEGITGPIDSKNEIYSGVMPPQDYLSDREISLILSYVRHSFGNVHDPAPLFEVAAMRAAIHN